MRMNRRIIYFLLLFLTVGFAAISTVFVLNGNVNFGINYDDYDIYFSQAILDSEDKSNVIISEDGLQINFESKEMMSIGDTTVLEYEVTNNSTQYDAQVSVVCENLSNSEYTTFTNTLADQLIPAQSKANGVLTVMLDKKYSGSGILEEEYTCTIKAEAVEKSEVVEPSLVAREYYANAYLSDSENNYLANKNIVVYSEVPHYIVSDDRGFFHVSGLEGGDHEVYVVEGKTTEELSAMSKDEVIAFASYKGTFNTSKKEMNFQDGVIVEDVDVDLGNPEVYDLTLDINGGVGNNYSIKTVEGKKLGRLFAPEHSTLLFNKWFEENIEYNSSTIVTSDIPKTLYAFYSTGVATIGEKHFASIINALNYITTDDVTEIDVIESHTVNENINFKKNVILDLNSNTVTFYDGFILNNATLEIGNGTLDIDAFYGIYNTSKLVLNNNLIINKDDTTYNSNQYISPLIYNMKDGNVELLGVTFNQTSAINTTQMIHNFGELLIAGGTYTATGTITGIVSNYGTTEVQGGVFDTTTIVANSISNYANSVFTINAGDNEVIFKGHPTSNKYLLYSEGETNILSGTVRVDNGYFLGSFGTFNLGSEATIPNVYGPDAIVPFDIRSGQGNFVSGNIYGTNHYIVSVSEGATVVSENVNYYLDSDTNNYRAVYVKGNFTMNGGLIESKNVSSGCVYVAASGVLNLNAGTFDGTGAAGNLIYALADSTINIGEEGKEFNFKGAGNNYYLLSTVGELNINAGIINVENAFFISSSNAVEIGQEGKELLINHSGKRFLTIKGTSVVNINSLTLNNSANGFASIASGAILNIYDINYNHQNSDSTTRAITVDGELNIIDGNFNIEGVSYGLALVNAGGVANITGGIYVAPTGVSGYVYGVAGSEINVGGEGSNLNFTGITDMSTFSSLGVLNFNGGSISLTNGYLFRVSGTANFYEGTVEILEGFVGYIAAGGVATVHSGTYLQSCDSCVWRMFRIYGTLYVNDGNFTSSGSTYGLLLIYESGIVNLLNGTYNNLQGNGTMGYVYEGGVLNIGSDTSEFTIINHEDYNTIYSLGEINVLGGKITHDGSALISNYNLLNIYDMEGYLNDSYAVFVYESGITNVYDATITQTSQTDIRRIFYNNGTLNIFDGDYTAAGTSYGVIQCNEGAVANITGGNFDASLAAGNLLYVASGAEANIGAEDTTITFVGSYSSGPLVNHGNTNILAGNIVVKESLGFYNAGTVNMGSETQNVNFTIDEGYSFMTNSENSVANLYNVNASTNGVRLMYIGTGATVNIFAGSYQYSNVLENYRMIRTFGTLNIYGGSFATVGETMGLITADPGATVNITSGTFQGDNVWGGAFYVEATAIMNIGELNSTNNITMSANQSGSNLLAVEGTLNIYSGYIYNALACAISTGYDEENNPDGTLPYVNIYGGELVSDATDHPTIYNNGGVLTMSGGTVTNTSGTYTIYNYSGTATQTGGVSANNYNVVVS